MDYSALGTGHEFGGHSKSNTVLGAWETPGGGGGGGADTQKHQRHARPRLDAFDVAADIFCLAVPLGLLGFLGAVVRLEGSETDDGVLRRWQNAISILATLFPMLFASIMGRMVYEMARWKLERGSSLGSLEQLLGSRTFGGTIVTQLHLPALNLLGLALILVWAFSPLGAQSVLRVLESPHEPVFTDTTVRYQDLRQISGFGDRSIASSGGAKAIDGQFNYLGNMFSTLLQLHSDLQADTADLWGNVKIPFLRETSTEQKEKWQDITWSNDVERFSSLAGIPISSIPIGNSTLNIESAYLDLSCSNITKYIASPLIIEMEWDWPNFWTSPGGGPPERGNGSWQGIGTNRTNQGFASSIGDASWGIALDRFVDYFWSNETEQYRRKNISFFDLEDEEARDRLNGMLLSPAILANETGIESGPTKLFFEAYLGDESHAAGDKMGAYCDVKQRYVESRIHCRRSDDALRHNCTAVAQRLSQKDHPPEDISVLSFPEPFLHIATRLPIASNQNIGVADRVIQWLDRMFVTSVRNPGERGVVFEDVDEASFSRRLSQVLNTYILLSTFNFGIRPDAGLTIWPNTTAPVEVSQLVLTCRVESLWVTLAFVCCGVLLVGGVLSVAFAHLARGPEVLGFASSVVRDSRLLDMPPSVGRMSGIQISREMKDLRLRYGYSDLTMQGRPLIGVGREQEMGPI